jgi:hypothetical protein
MAAVMGQTEVILMGLPLLRTQVVAALVQIMPTPQPMLEVLAGLATLLFGSMADEKSINTRHSYLPNSRWV